jgi:hypothetical protein
MSSARKAAHESQPVDHPTRCSRSITTPGIGSLTTPGAGEGLRLDARVAVAVRAGQLSPAPMTRSPVHDGPLWK